MRLHRRNRAGPAWTHTLNEAQIATVRRIHLEGNGRTRSSQGWRLYMQPTTMPARYLELRHYMTDGRVARWIIEQDGSVSSHNDQATRSAMELV